MTYSLININAGAEGAGKNCIVIVSQIEFNRNLGQLRVYGITS